MRTPNGVFPARMSRRADARPIRARFNREKEENLCNYSIHQTESNAPKPLALGTDMVGSKVVGMKRPAIKLLIEPAKYADFGSAERFEPTVDQKLCALNCGRYLFRFLDDRFRVT